MGKMLRNNTKKNSKPELEQRSQNIVNEVMRKIRAENQKYENLTEEERIEMNKTDRETMNHRRVYMLVAEWAKAGKEYFTAQDVKNYEGFNDLTEKEIDVQLKDFLRISLVHHDGEDIYEYENDTKLYFSDDYLGILNGTLL